MDSSCFWMRFWRLEGSEQEIIPPNLWDSRVVGSGVGVRRPAYHVSEASDTACPVL